MLRPSAPDRGLLHHSVCLFQKAPPGSNPPERPVSSQLAAAFLWFHLPERGRLAANRRPGHHQEAHSGGRSPRSRTESGLGVWGRPDPQIVGRTAQVSSLKPSDSVYLRIIAETLPPLALHDPFVIVQSQQRDGHPPDRRFTGETPSFQSKMIFPSIRARIEEAGILTGLGDERTEVRAFGAIAAGAGQREVRSLRPTSVFPTDHVVHFATGQQGPLG